MNHQWCTVLCWAVLAVVTFVLQGCGGCEEAENVCRCFTSCEGFEETGDGEKNCHDGEETGFTEKGIAALRKMNEKDPCGFQKCGAFCHKECEEAEHKNRSPWTITGCK